MAFFSKSCGTEKYCNGNCVARCPIYHVAKTVPDYLVQVEAEKIFKSPCPICRKARPIDVPSSHKTGSALVMTSWNSRARFSCKPCGVRSQALAAAQSLLLGRWGIPWTILGTPVTIGRNDYVMATKIGADRPSAALLSQTRSALAAQSIQQSRQSDALR